MNEKEIVVSLMLGGKLVEVVREEIRQPSWRLQASTTKKIGGCPIHHNMLHQTYYLFEALLVTKTIFATKVFLVR